MDTPHIIICWTSPTGWVTARKVSLDMVDSCNVAILHNHSQTKAAALARGVIDNLCVLCWVGVSIIIIIALYWLVQGMGSLKATALQSMDRSSSVAIMKASGLGKEYSVHKCLVHWVGGSIAGLTPQHPWRNSTICLGVRTNHLVSYNGNIIKFTRVHTFSKLRPN